MAVCGHRYTLATNAMLEGDPELDACGEQRIEIHRLTLDVVHIRHPGCEAPHKVAIVGNDAVYAVATEDGQPDRDTDGRPVLNVYRFRDVSLGDQPVHLIPVNRKVKPAHLVGMLQDAVTIMCPAAATAAFIFVFPTAVYSRLGEPKHFARRFETLVGHARPRPPVKLVSAAAVR